MKSLPFDFNPQRERLTQKPEVIAEVPWSELMGASHPELEGKRPALPDSPDTSDTPDGDEEI